MPISHFLFILLLLFFFKGSAAEVQAVSDPTYLDPALFICTKAANVEYSWLMSQEARRDPKALDFFVAENIVHSSAVEYPSAFGNSFNQQALIYVFYDRFNELLALPPNLLLKTQAQFETEPKKNILKKLIKSCLSRPIVRSIGRIRDLH